jgi:hypothetical protein
MEQNKVQDALRWRKMERKVQRRKVMVEVIVFLCVLLFVYTALSKLISVPKFMAQIRNAPYIGPFAWLIVWAVPGVELLIAGLMMVPKWRIWGLRLFTGLMVVFTVYICLIIWVAPHIPCSCGGVLEQLGWGDHLVLNVVFIGLGIWGYRMWKRVWESGNEWR